VTARTSSYVVLRMALIPPNYLKAVVALGTDGDEQGERLWVASGFHYFHRVADENGEARYQPFLVTNRHVVDRTASLYVRINPVDGNVREYQLFAGTEDAPLWTTHPDPEIDIAVTHLNYELFQTGELDTYFLQSDTDCADVTVMAAAGVTEGDFVYFLGFPMGLVGTDRDSVLARSGTIARISDMLAGGASSFVLDASVFPGSSGGPVVLKPEYVSITGTEAVNRAYTIGVVAGYLHYPDVAISQQSGRPRVVFEENAGLAVAFPMDAVFATAEHALGLIPPELRSDEESQAGGLAIEADDASRGTRTRRSINRSAAAATPEECGPRARP